MSLTRRTIVAAPAVVAATSLGAPLMAQTSGSAPAPTSMKQAPSVYRYKAGDIVITAMHEGTAVRPLDEKFIPNAPIAEVKAAMREAFLPEDKLPITFTPLVINTGRNVVLIDTGFGENGSGTTGNMYANLPAAGFDAAKIDTVVLSHFHGDHIMGLLKKDGSRAFPNAQILVPAAEWAFWTDEGKRAAAPEGMKGAFDLVKRSFDPYKGAVTPFDDGKEIVPGITAMAAPGHTPGHTAFSIGTGNDRVVMVADITNHPALFVRHPDWSPVFDMNAEQARATRRKFLDMAAADRVQLAFYHAPFPATGYISKEGNGYEFVPVQWSSTL